MFKKKHSAEISQNWRERERIDEYLREFYLQQEYIVPSEIDHALDESVEALRDMPGFEGIVNVGGTANGSYMLRKMTSPNPATDLDFYLIGNGNLNRTAAAEIVGKKMRAVGVSLDGELNGTHPNNYLNLDQIDMLINQGDAALLALPFQSFYGPDKNAVQRKILKAILARPDAQEVWDEVANFHAQSLSLHHGSFSLEFAQHVLDDYYPAKVAKFELSITPQEMYERIMNQP